MSYLQQGSMRRTPRHATLTSSGATTGLGVDLRWCKVVIIAFTSVLGSLPTISMENSCNSPVFALSIHCALVCLKMPPMGRSFTMQVVLVSLVRVGHLRCPRQEAHLRPAVTFGTFAIRSQPSNVGVTGFLLFACFRLLLISGQFCLFSRVTASTPLALWIIYPHPLLIVRVMFGSRVRQ